jgi:hypothetical protein
LTETSAFSIAHGMQVHRAGASEAMSRLAASADQYEISCGQTLPRFT